MKKTLTIKTQIVFLLFVSVFFTACNNDDDGFLPPEYALPQVSEVNGQTSGTFAIGRVINLNIQLIAQGFLDRLVIARNSTQIDEVVYTEGGSRTYNFSIEVDDTWLGTTQTFSFTLFDKQGQQSEPFVFTAEISDLVPTYEITDVEINGESFRQITGIINFDETLTAADNWLLNGVVTVDEIAVLTIEPGTTVYALDNTTQFLVIPGGQVIADGTAEMPIVFTSFAKAPGQSGNASAGDWISFEVEGGGAGTASSGIYKYLRVEYAGLDTDALRLVNVSSATTFEYIQNFASADNGIRINGGDVNATHLVATRAGDVGIRYGSGWVGKGQFWVANTDNAGGTGIQGRDDGSNPVLSNLTVTGPALNGGGDPSGDGIRIRNNARVSIYNALVTGVGTSLRMSNGSENFVPTGEIIFRNSASFNNDANSGTGFHSTAAPFNPTSGSYDASNNNSVTPFAVTNSFVGTSTANSVDASTIDTFFEAVNYVGAVPDGNDWTLGWTLNIDGSLRQ